MDSIVQKIKKIGIIFCVFVCIACVSYRCEITTYAYTREEKEAAKAWLSANGYSPDAGGAYAAYEDYMNGKFGAIPGLPEPNVRTEQSQPSAEGSEEQLPEKEVEAKEEPEEEADEKSDDESEEEADELTSEEEEMGTTSPSGEVTAPPPVDDAPEPEVDVLRELDTEEPDMKEETGIVMPNTSQQEFADVIEVFVSEFSEEEQGKINKAKERLENQKQERAAAEKEAEYAAQTDYAPQKNIIIILCGVLAIALIGLGITLFSKKQI